MCESIIEFEVVVDDSVKHEGDNSVLVYKHTVEDYEAATKLIVRESQEAILVVDGVIKKVYKAGAHIIKPNAWSKTCESEKNYPIHSQVYFVNLVDQMAIPWGTSSKVQYMEPNYNFPISIGASGQLSVKVADSEQLIRKIVGTESTFEKYQIRDIFNAFLVTKVKTYLAQEIKNNRISIFEIDEKLEELSSSIKEKLYSDFEEYGLKLSKFFIMTIAKPDNDSVYQRYRDLYFRKYADIEDARIRQEVGIIDQQAEAQKMEIEANALARKRKIEGYSYQEEHAIKDDISAEQVMLQNRFCDQCGQKLLPNAAYCHNCGAQQNDNYKCGKCGFVFVRTGTYCPNCGNKR